MLNSVDVLWVIKTYFSERPSMNSEDQITLTVR